MVGQYFSHLLHFLLAFLLCAPLLSFQNNADNVRDRPANTFRIYINYMKRIRAGAIVINDDKVLLMYRKINDNEYFVFPGGGVEVNETLEQTAERESMEETSVVVKAMKPLYRLIDENNDQRFFLCEYISGEPKFGNGSEFLSATESNVYKPMWKEIRDLANLSIMPLEVRDWFIADLKNSFKDCPREATIMVADRRKI
jgi:8-oxo-dGTP diphosphatase